MKKKKWIPKIEELYQNINTHSWFDMKITKNLKENDHYNKFLCSDIITRTKKIILYPTPTQSIILNKWFELFRKMYNITTDFLKGKIFDDNKKLDKESISKYLNFRKLRSEFLKSKRDKLLKYNINAHLLDQAISRCVSMYKSAISNYKNGNINDFNVRQLKISKRYKNLIVEGVLFSKKKNGFCISVLKEMAGNEELIGIKSTCVLTYDKYKSSYILSVPVVSVERNCETRMITCGIDPGVRSFLTVYSKNDVLQISNNHNIFRKYFKKIDVINSQNPAEESNQTRKYRRAIGKVYDKIGNMVKDMHFKVSKYLCTHYNILKLGKISTKKIISNITSNINGKTKRMLTTLSHYKFRERIQHQAEKYGVTVKVVSEYMTTKKCSKCETINEVGKSKIYKCDKCVLHVDRDVNAAKNIRYV